MVRGQVKPNIKKNGRQPLALKDQSPQDRDRPPSKRPRPSSSNCTAEEKLHQEAASDPSTVLDLERKVA